MKGKMKSGSIVILLLAIASLCNAQSPEKLLNEYRNNLIALRKLHLNVYSALDYLLKPLNNEQLQNAVIKVSTNRRTWEGFP